MKIAVICAKGKEGKLIAQEAVARGADVTAVVRGETREIGQECLSEFFDLSQKPIFREQFSFGGMKSNIHHFFVNMCNGCKLCMKVCPQNCIDITDYPA